MRDARSGIIKHNNFDNVPIEPRKKTPSYNYLQQMNSSPINILEQENKKPSLPKYGQTECEKYAIGPQNYKNLKKSYETKPKFFDIDYQRIQQLKGKYLQTYGIRNQMLQYEPLQEIRQEFRGSIHKANERQRGSHIKSTILLQNDKNIEFQDKPLEIQNEQLKNYMMKYSVMMNTDSVEAPNEATQHTLSKIHQINEEIENKMSNLFKRLQKKQEKRKKRKQAEELQQIPQKAERLEVMPKFQDRTSQLFSLIDNQIRLDIKFRTLREKIPKTEFDRILAAVQSIEPAISREILQLHKSQINPFENKEDKKLEDGIEDRLVSAYREAQKHFQQELVHKIDMKIVQEWIDQVNIDRSDHISMGNILTQLNLRVQGEYRHRDILRLVLRFGGAKEINQAAFRKMLAK